MPERDPFYTKIWRGYRRDTAMILAAIAFVVLLQYLYLLYKYFVLSETLSGGATAVAILLAGVILLTVGEWFAMATVRGNGTHRMLWRTAGLVAAGTVLPIVVLYFMVP